MSQSETDICRYCLEVLDCESGDIFDPCNCKSKVHKKCFIHWLQTRPFDPSDDEIVLGKCEICKTKYKRRYRKYVKDIFRKRSLIVQLQAILYRNQHNQQTDESNCTCFMIWLGLFFSLMILISVESNYDPGYNPNNTIEYNYTI
tara:strand:+ start:11 stop:445 length:435 start_codon:yes stop_codon:yes gene_type:complete